MRTSEHKYLNGGKDHSGTDCKPRTANTVVVAAAAAPSAHSCIHRCRRHWAALAAAVASVAAAVASVAAAAAAENSAQTDSAQTEG